MIGEGIFLIANLLILTMNVKLYTEMQKLKALHKR